MLSHFHRTRKQDHCLNKLHALRNTYSALLFTTEQDLLQDSFQIAKTSPTRQRQQLPKTKNETSRNLSWNHTTTVLIYGTKCGMPPFGFCPALHLSIVNEYPQIICTSGFLGTTEQYWQCVHCASMDFGLLYQSWGCNLFSF